MRNHCWKPLWLVPARNQVLLGLPTLSEPDPFILPGRASGKIDEVIQPLNVQEFLAQVLVLRRCSGFLRRPPLHVKARVFFLLPQDGAVGSPQDPERSVSGPAQRHSPGGAFPPPRQPFCGQHLWKGTACPSHAAFGSFPTWPLDRKLKRQGISQDAGVVGSRRQTIGREIVTLLQRPHLPPKSQQPRSRHANPSF